MQLPQFVACSHVFVFKTHQRLAVDLASYEGYLDFEMHVQESDA